MHRREFLQQAAAAFVAPRFGATEELVRYDRPVSDDLFVLIPGIMGSELYVDGKPVWSPRPSAVFESLKSLGGNLQRLKLAGDSDVDDSLGDGVIVGGLIPDMHIIPGFVKVDGYSTIRRKLISQFGLQPNKNYFEFAYDWRRDNRAVGRRLQRDAASWLNRWRAESPSKEKAKLILIGHSMGGLIARYFLEALGGWELTRAFVTLGTPYRGSMKALDYASNGYVKEQSTLAPLNELIRSFTSIYQLMPIYDCCASPQSGAPISLTALSAVPNIEMERVGAALKFHEEMRDKAAANRQNHSYIGQRYQLCPIVGIGQPTATHATVSLSSLKVSIVEGVGSGDGTVSRIGAEPPLGESSGYYVNEFHGSLQNNEAAWWQLNGILERLYLTPKWKFLTLPDEILEARVNAMPLDPELALLVDDAYSAKDGFQCAVKRVGSAVKPNVTVTVQSAVTGRAITKQVTTEAENRWEVVTFGALEPGMYRCSASAAEQLPGFREKSGTITDMFLVV